MSKRFLPGNLNPLYEGEGDFDIDLEEFNNPYYVNELQKKILESQLEQDLFAGMSNPKAVILGPAKFSYQNSDTDYAVPVHSTSTLRKMFAWYYFRIPEIHSHLPDPCSPRLLLRNRGAAYKAIYDHPIAPYIPADPNIEPPQILPGSVVEIKFDRGPNAGLGLFPKITRVVGESYGILNTPECESALKDFEQAMSNGDFSTVGGLSSGPLRQFPLNASCVPKSRDANNVEDYFGKAGAQQIRDFIGRKESGNKLRPTAGKKPPSNSRNSGWRSLAATNYKSEIDGVNYAGYSGKYQMSIVNIVAAGYIKSSIKNELISSKCTEQGPHCVEQVFRILNDPESWTSRDGIKNIDDFLNSSKAQDHCMNRLLNANLKQLDKLGEINRDSPQDVAGMLGASHLLGAGGAIDMRNGSGGTDANNTSGNSYYESIGKKCPAV